MLVHTVLFWLKKDLEADQVARFLEGVESLKNISSAEAVYVGTPSETPERPVIDTSYDVCLTVILKDIPAHDAYQTAERHLQFIEENKEKWTRYEHTLSQSYQDPDKLKEIFREKNLLN